MARSLLAATLALLVISSLVDAQDQRGSPPSLIDGLTITSDWGAFVELPPGGIATVTFTLTNNGSVPLDLVIVTFGGFGGGGRASGVEGGGGHGGGAPPPPGGGQGGAGGHGGGGNPSGESGGPSDARASHASNATGDGEAGGFQRLRAVRAVPVGDPELTLDPAATVTISYEITVNASAPGGDYPINVGVTQRDQDRAARANITVRVVQPATNATSDATASGQVEPATETTKAVPAPELVFLAAAIALLALSRRRR